MSIQSRDIFINSFFVPGGILDLKINQDATDEELSEQFGVSPETIRNWFLRTGFRRKKRAKLSKLNAARIVTLSNAGMEIEDIVDIAFSRSITPDMARRALSEMSLEEAQDQIERMTKQFTPKLPRKRRKKQIKDPAGRHKRRSHWTPEQKEQVVELLSAGVEAYEVWRITGASKRRQRLIAKEFGVSI
jgi:transposase-like protein